MSLPPTVFQMLLMHGLGAMTMIRYPGKPQVRELRKPRARISMDEMWVVEIQKEMDEKDRDEGATKNSGCSPRHWRGRELHDLDYS